MKKRIYALVLCMSMLLGLLSGGVPLTAQAETTDSPTLQLGEGSTGYCAACGKNARWEPLMEGAYLGGYTPEMSALPNHYYFAQDNMTTGNAEYFLRLEGGTSFCLHLNGKSVTFLSPIEIANGTLSILGDGKVDFASQKDAEDTAFISASS